MSLRHSFQKWQKIKKSSLGLGFVGKKTVPSGGKWVHGDLFMNCKLRYDGDEIQYVFTFYVKTKIRCVLPTHDVTQWHYH